MFFLEHIWVIPLLPMASAAVMFFFGRKLSKQAVNAFCVGTVALAFVCRAWRCISTRDTLLRITMLPSRK